MSQIILLDGYNTYTFLQKTDSTTPPSSRCSVMCL